jgi:hypothetical protein
LRRDKNPPDERVIGRAIVLKTVAAGLLPHSAASAAFSVALGRIAADALAGYGK